MLLEVEVVAARAVGPLSLKVDGEVAMSFIRTAVITLALLAAGAPALARQSPAPRPVPIVVPQSAAGNMSEFYLQNERRTAIARAHAGKVQWERATQVASLINANRCKDAYLLAAGENDQLLAKRVHEVCTAPPSPLQ
jgi:hypothetical protein